MRKSFPVSRRGAHGNDADIEACKVQGEAEDDRASLYGCSDERDLLRECIELESECENDFYTVEDRCDDESLDYGSCMGDQLPF